jgi:hypothetical protein
MSEFDNLGKIFKNTIVTIIIIILILCFIPTLTYIYSYFNFNTKEKLLNKLITTPIKIDMEHNTLENIYLLSNYIPYKRNKRCEQFKPGDEELKKYNTAVVHAYNISKKFNKIKIECDGHFYNDIKKNSDIAIQKEKDLRLEHERKMAQTEKENEPENKNLIFKYLKGIFSIFKGLGKFTFDLGKMGLTILNFFTVIAAAGFRNHVLMGFIILVFIIFMILYFVKLRHTTTTSQPNTNTNSVTNSSFSWFNGDLIWSEFSETFKYYDNMMNAFTINMANYTGGIFSTTDNTEGGANNGDPTTASTITIRKTQDGKRYDNLSYINLSSLDLTEDEKGKLKNYLPVDIESNKYYNIYLPEEKFKYDNKPSIVKWKVETSLSNPKEKIWKINCSEIDKIKNTVIPAFIDDVNNKQKCLININRLENANAAVIQDDRRIIYDTENIK